MDILARRLTIITLLMAVFAIFLTMAVESDARRQQRANADVSSACITTEACRTAF